MVQNQSKHQPSDVTDPSQQTQLTSTYWCFCEADNYYAGRSEVWVLIEQVSSRVCFLTASLTASKSCEHILTPVDSLLLSDLNDHCHPVWGRGVMSWSHRVSFDCRCRSTDGDHIQTCGEHAHHKETPGPAGNHHRGQSETLHHCAAT